MSDDDRDTKGEFTRPHKVKVKIKFHFDKTAMAGKIDFSGDNVGLSGALHCTSPGPYVLWFTVERGENTEWVKFVKLDDWPLIVGETGKDPDSPDNYDTSEFLPPVRDSDNTVKVTFKHINLKKNLAYRLTVRAKSRSTGEIKTFEIDPRIINRQTLARIRK